MNSSELKLGHAYKVAGKEGPAFYVNCHPHDGASHVMAWSDPEQDEEIYFIVDACEIEYEILASDTVMVFTEQYEAFQLAGRLLQKMPTILEHVKSIEARAASEQGNHVLGDRTWHALETIDDRCFDLISLLEKDMFDALTGADRREAQMVELRLKAHEYDRITKIAGETGENVHTRMFQEWLNDQRNRDVSSVFHEIVARFRKATQPDSGRDAALDFSSLKPYEACDLPSGEEVFIADDVRALAAHPAPSSDAAPTPAGECKLPPPGWRCTRPAGHEGPCAAVAK